MEKYLRKLLIVIIIINFLGIMIKGITVAYSNVTETNNSIEKDRLEKLKER
ncbi:hypothetical protein [Clostridium saccharoperbutylacetonicum]|uniref:hypothetical protein n=1 Tax=Clostridium saccharoperbutylacetonicum TaxID=36745 RepID=UPI0039EC2D65